MINVLKLPTPRRRTSRHHRTRVRLYLAAAALLLAYAPAAAAQQCLHGPDETASERRRREQALQFVARVNDAQRAALQARGGYVALADAVPAREVPLGFVPRLTVDAWSYVISLKDLFDPCGFAVFSDQDGRIYEGRPAALPASAGDGNGGAAPAVPTDDTRESRE